MKYILKRTYSLDGGSLNIEKYLDKLEDFDIKRYKLKDKYNDAKYIDVFVIDLKNLEELNRLKLIVKNSIIISTLDYELDNVVCDIDMPNMTIEIYDHYRE